jgi:predicted GH43/DUF377 family glycosyl hydrolase
MRTNWFIASALCLCLLATAAENIPPAPAPLWRDAQFDGAADPNFAFNRKDGSLWLFYTQRRARATNDFEGVMWCHGTELGIAVSKDGGQKWSYQGTAQGLVHGQGRATWWAPDLVWDGQQYHLFVTYVDGLHKEWTGVRHIIHFTSADLLNWKSEGRIPLSSERCLDGTVDRLPDGSWRMWYNDEGHGKTIWVADSPDLKTWKIKGQIIGKPSQEGPYVFQWKGFYWMLTDCWDGLAVFRSPDAETWTRQPQNLLKTPGKRACDTAKGGHPCAVVQGDSAWVIYHCHWEGKNPTAIQAARLELTAEHWLTADRDASPPFKLTMDKAQAVRGGGK